MTVNAVAFDAAAVVAVALGVAAAVLEGRRGALATGGCIAAVGVLSAVAGSELTGATEVAVGAGVAVALHRGPGGARRARPARWRTVAAALVAAGLAALVLAVAAVSTGVWRSAPYPQSLADGGTARTTAERLVGTYSLPLAATAVLLLAATVVAVVLARRDEREAAHDRAIAERRQREERMRRRREDRARARAGRRDATPEPAFEEGEG